MKSCENCRYRKIDEKSLPCSACIDLGRDLSGWVGMTNADRIRAMTDEELVKQFAVEMGFCCPVKGVDCSLEPDCRVCFARWLKREAKEDE